jgi:mono/diheme cytochrome c family protein
LEKKPPNLRRTDLFTQHSEAELMAWILHGKELPVAVQPPASPHTEEEVAALLAHLQRLPMLPWQEVKAGKKVYDSLCVACHGLYGRGNGRAVAALASPPRDISAASYQNQVNDAELLHIVTEGKGAMPGATDVLNPQELRAVVAFMRILSPGYELYDRFCTACHGADGFPPTVVPRDRFGFELIFQNMPTFDQEYFRTHSDEHIRAGIQHMRKQSRPAMPHFAGELNADEVSQILTYLRNLLPES